MAENMIQEDIDRNEGDCTEMRTHIVFLGSVRFGKVICPVFGRRVNVGGDDDFTVCVSCGMLQKRLPIRILRVT